MAFGYSYGCEVRRDLVDIESFQGFEADSLVSWNRDLSLQRAIGMGGEFRTKGANVFLGPVVSPLGRTITSGRNWEGKHQRHSKAVQIP